MKLLLITILSAILGNSAIAALPQAQARAPSETQSSVTSQYLSQLQSKIQLVQDMKSSLIDVNTDKKLSEQTEKTNDYSATYSPKVQTLVSGIRPLLLNSQDRIFDAVSIVHGWCNSADVLLDTFLEMFASDDIASRNEILQGLFDLYSNTELVDKLDKAADSLRNASSLVSNISTEFESSFTEQSPLFKVLVRHEILKDENNHYSAKVVDAIMKEVQKYIENPELLKQMLSSTNIVSAASSAIGTHTNQQAPSATEKPTEETTISPQTYTRLRDLVFNQFESTRKFFVAYQNTIDRTISSVEEIKAKVLGNDQRGTVDGNVKPQSNSNAKLKNAARTLKNTCKQFTISYAQN